MFLFTFFVCYCFLLDFVESSIAVVPYQCFFLILFLTVGLIFLHFHSDESPASDRNPTFSCEWWQCWLSVKLLKPITDTQRYSEDISYHFRVVAEITAARSKASRFFFSRQTVMQTVLPRDIQRYSDDISCHSRELPQLLPQGARQTVLPVRLSGGPRMVLPGPHPRLRTLLYVLSEVTNSAPPPRITDL